MSHRNRTQKRSIPRMVMLVFVPLALNALLYLTYRDWSLWCFRWVEFGGSEDLIVALRDLGRALPLPPEWVRYSLASGLWIFGVVSFLHMTFGPRSRAKSLWILSILAICIGSEVLQWASIIPGTADSIDALAYLLGTLAATIWALRIDLAEPKLPVTRPHFAAASLVGFALLLATGAIYEGAMAELVAMAWAS
ncbi:MAG: hypothetical protein ACI8Q9_000397 [Planctomycetota bacterium]|jgi:hypothetical protein